MLVKAIALWIIVLSAPAWAKKIDILMVFTPSGAQEAAQATGELDPGPILIEQANDTFQISTLIRPLELLDTYYLTEDIWAWKSVDILLDAEKCEKDWGKEICYRREMLGADMVLVVWGADDVHSPRGYGGWSRAGAAYITVRGEYVDRKNIPHEFGHAFGREGHSDNPWSVMSVDWDYYARVGYTPEEVVILTPIALAAHDYRSRKENNCAWEGGDEL